MGRRSNLSELCDIASCGIGHVSQHYVLCPDIVEVEFCLRAIGRHWSSRSILSRVVQYNAWAGQAADDDET